MAILVTYNMIERQVSNQLGLILGGDIATAETNYTAAGTTANRKEPDFPPLAVQDAILSTLGELAQVIAETPLHPDRVDMVALTSALGSGITLPGATAGGVPFIGRWGRVIDSSSNVLLEPMSIDAVRSFLRFSASVYSGKTMYWYAIQNNHIYHTRTAVIVEGCAWNRPTWGGSSLIPFGDTYEWPIVWGAVLRLADREWKDSGLFAAAKGEWEGCLARIRSFADPVALTAAASAPAVV